MKGSHCYIEIKNKNAVNLLVIQFVWLLCVNLLECYNIYVKRNLFSDRKD